MLEMAGQYVRLESDVVKNIIYFMELEGNPKYADICHKCVGGCRCVYKDRYAKDVLIESYIPLVRGYILTAYQSRQEWYLREILSEGLLILTETVNRLHSNIEDPKKFITSHVVLSIRRFVMYDTLIKTRGVKMKRHPHDDGRHVVTYSHTIPNIDFDDMVNTIITDVREKAVLQALYEGYSTIEIGEQVGCSPSTVSRLRYKIYDSIAEASK